MKKILLFMFLFLSFNIYGQNKKEQIKRLTSVADSLNRLIALRSAELTDNQNELVKFKTQYFELDNRITSCKDSIEILSNSNQQINNKIVDAQQKVFEYNIKEYIRAFYNSLELSTTENDLANKNGDNFKKTAFKSFLKTAKSYSKERVKHLTSNYDTYTSIALVEIIKITFDDSIISVETKAEYSIYEGGTFHNFEEIQLIFNNNKFEMLAWYDIKIKEKQASFSLWGYSRKELLNMLGTNPK